MPGAIGIKQSIVIQVTGTGQQQRDFTRIDERSNDTGSKKYEQNESIEYTDWRTVNNFFLFYLHNIEV